MKTKFTATFSNGQTINRNSEHPYAFAWAIISKDGTIHYSGFSEDRVNAAKGAEIRMPKPLSDRDRKNASARRYWARMAKAAGVTLEAWIKQIDDRFIAQRAELRVEIVAL